MDVTFTEETPVQVRESKALQLFTEGTHNGRKVHIMLEELRSVYGLSWDTHLIDLETEEQKKPWYLHINPAARIPVVVDSTRSPPVAVTESSAILVYLQEHYDPDNVFGFSSAAEKSQALQWLFFWHGVSPIHGSTRYFMGAEEPVPSVVQRFRSLILITYSILEAHLSGNYQGTPRDYLAGSGPGKFSIADIGNWAHVRAYSSLGFSDEDMAPFPDLLKWIDRIAQREAVQIGIGEKYNSEKNPALVLPRRA